MNEHNSKKEGEREQISFDMAFSQLQEILTVMEGIGLTVPDFCRSADKMKKDWENKYAFPIAREGLDGVRAVRKPDGHFRVWFTNGFEKPNNPERVKITETLRAKGFDVV